MNQDAVLIGDELCAVSDGMGERGALASVLAVEILQAGFTDRTAAGLTEACSAANRVICRRAEAGQLSRVGPESSGRRMPRQLTEPFGALRLANYRRYFAG